MSLSLRNRLPFAMAFNLWALIFAIAIHPFSSTQAQISNFKMGDTLLLKPNDEFLDIRLSKFSTVQMGERPFLRTLVYYDGKPFSGTIIKSKGLTMRGRDIIGSFAEYSVNEEDQTSFVVSFRNGKFFGRYIEDNEEAIIMLWFDQNGDPDKEGEIIVKKTGPRYFQNFPSPYPKFIGLTTRFSNGNYFVEFYGDDQLGVFDHRGNTQSVRIIPIGSQSLNEIIYKYAIIDPEFMDCKAMDTIKYSFSKNHLINFNFKDNCNSKVVFEKSDMIKDMPIFGSASNYEIDYSHLLFQDNFSNFLASSQDYYINEFISGESGLFFSPLDKLPAWAKITLNDYNCEINFDLVKAKRSAKQILLKDFLSSEKPHGPYQDPIYQLSLPVKSFDINCDIIINNTETKHLRSKYVISTDENYDLASEYWYDGDTVTIKTAGDLKNGTLKKFEFHMNPKTKPLNGEMRWLNIEYKGNGLYSIEASGRLGWDEVKNAQITSYQIFAKSTNQKYSDSKSLKLKPDGTTTFTFEDGTTKQYKYKDGELIID